VVEFEKRVLRGYFRLARAEKQEVRENYIVKNFITHIYRQIK
jgi:hypothetical protein